MTSSPPRRSYFPLTTTKECDDNQYGSAAVRDIEALAALSKRIHFGECEGNADLQAPSRSHAVLFRLTGMYVSESKFRSDPKAFVGPIQSRDRKALEDLITKPAVEAALLVRLASKAKVYGQNLNSSVSEDRKIDEEVAVRLYRDFVIPLTKVVEVDYLLKR